MRWLHLSDLHIGTSNPAQQTAIRALVVAIEKFSNGIPFDAVFMTGDLAYSGRQEEYDELVDLIVRPLQQLSITEQAQLLAVPGNHDLDCDVGGPPLHWNGLGENRQQNVLSDSKIGRSLRRARAEGFRAYEECTNVGRITTCAPRLCPVAVAFVTPSSGRQIDVICINTAFFSDKEVPDQRSSPAPVDSLRDLFHSEELSPPVLVLGHHPLNWFLREFENHLKTLLIENNAVYLHGHEHEITSSFGPKGLVSLGFGAAYQSPLSGRAKTYYRNTFAICELTDTLAVEFISWDSEYGSWIPETRLPADLRGDTNGRPCVLPVPTSKISLSTRDRIRSAVASAAIRPRVQSPTWIECDPKEGWLKLLQGLGVLGVVTEVSLIGPSERPGGAVQFVARDRAGRHLVRAFSAPSSTIAYAHIEQANTFLDTEPLDSCILATFGTISEDATTLTARLKHKKSLTVLTGADIAERISKFDLIAQICESISCDLESIALTPLIVPEGIAVLVSDTPVTDWFYIIAADGTVLHESADLVFQVRKILPELKPIHYGRGSTESGSTTVEQQFDRNEYLARSAALFDTVRYAGLAAIGFQLPVDSLRKLYVPAAADVSSDLASDEALKTAVDDFVEALGLDAAQRDQVEMQLRNHYGLGRSEEAGAASKLYQKYGAILVVGDPGSGKSCFVRYEILAYCQPPSNNRDWYSKHTPVFLPLVEAARMMDRDEDLLDICAKFAASQRLRLTRHQLDILLSKGEVAFFFDGIDEVGSLAVRQDLLRQICVLIDGYAGLGNRFVLTSRPAAIHSVEIPDYLVRLTLRGLTNEEISILATRILSLDPATGDISEQLTADDSDVLVQLMRDCEEKQGIRRLARNPLLLELMSNLVYGLRRSGGLPADRPLIDSINKIHTGDNIGQLAEAA